jgi:hypothetical protein
VSDEHSAGTEALTPAPVGAFDWLVESHQQALAMAPQGAPSDPPSQRSPLTELPAEPPEPAPFSIEDPPLASARFGGGPGPSALVLERHGGGARSGNRPLDWIAFVLAFLAPPVGLILAIVAVVTGSRAQGYASAVAKAAIAIAAALSVVLGVAYVVESKVADDHAAHQAIVDSSAAWCTALASNPRTLASGTFGWPAPGDTIPASIAAIKRYQAHWVSLERVAPAGIRADTRKVANTAATIEARVRATLTLGDANNIAQMENVVATSAIPAWATSYCG